MSHLYAWLFFITSALVIWGMLSSHRCIPTWVHRHDKAMHFVAFAWLAFLAQGAWPHIGLVSIWYVLTLGGLMGEGLQGLVSQRKFCIKDATANALGAATSLGAIGWLP